MAYSKTQWVNEGPPALSAENLNKMEDGIYDNDAKITALQAIAATLPEIRAGSLSAGTVPINSYVDVNVSFSTPMSEIPTVLVSMNSSSTSPEMGSIEAAAYGITKTGFTLRVFNNNRTGTGRQPSVSYVAFCGGAI